MWFIYIAILPLIITKFRIEIRRTLETGGRYAFDQLASALVRAHFYLHEQIRFIPAFAGNVLTGPLLRSATMFTSFGTGASWTKGKLREFPLEILMTIAHSYIKLSNYQLRSVAMDNNYCNRGCRRCYKKCMYIIQLVSSRLTTIHNYYIRITSFWPKYLIDGTTCA